MCAKYGVIYVIQVKPYLARICAFDRMPGHSPEQVVYDELSSQILIITFVWM